MAETSESIDRPVMSVSHLAKKYCRELRRSLWYGLGDMAREFSMRSARDTAGTLRKEEFWALEEVSFELRRGESLAIIGANGAGKSTLLKLLYGLIKPDAGHVRINGRVSALIELGTGFNPVLTGRENVHVSAAMLGMTRRQIALFLEKIVEFSEIGEFIDTPVQYYSSGMTARLAYAVAAHIEPALMLVDEVLAVGDMTYQRKCVNHMLKYLESGGTLVFVSHSPYLIQSMCRRGIVLEHGQLTFCGSAVEALNYYFESQRRVQDVPSRPSYLGADKNHPVVIESIVARAKDGGDLWTGEQLQLILKYNSLAPIHAVWGFSIWTVDQLVRITGGADMTPNLLAAGQGELRCLIPRNPLLAGSYLLKAAILEAASMQTLALLGWAELPMAFSVRSRPTELNNYETWGNQLVNIDIEWA
jgi:lipopolysaccharide transport system ATP-binding protein